jgi:hypothetical protein
MEPGVDSLNVGVAAGFALSALRPVAPGATAGDSAGDSAREPAGAMGAAIGGNGRSGRSEGEAGA